jgi:hypothetical protein
LPPYRTRKEPIRDPWLNESIARAAGKHHPKTGHYAELVIGDCASREEAQEEVRALHRAGRRLGVSVIAGIEKRGKLYDVRFRAVHKDYGRAHIVAKYGTDRSKWPYDPRRRGE